MILRVGSGFLRLSRTPPPKVNVAASENDHKRTVETHYYAVSLHTGQKARRKCFKAEERVHIREENKDSERVMGSKLVRFTSVFLGPRPESRKLARDAGKAQNGALQISSPPVVADASLHLEKVILQQ